VQSSMIKDARERFDAAQSAYSEARELGFSRTRSVYEAAREALLFGVAQEPEKSITERHLTQEEPMPLRGVARLKAERLEREQRKNQRQEQELTSPPDRERKREASVWDALDDMGHEPRTRKNGARKRSRLRNGIY